MAACHPKLSTHTGAELYLSRFADGEWRGVVRPWLEAGRGRLERTLVVAPTRGHTQALKQRCLEEGVALLGVEFLTPALARKKRGLPAGISRSLQLLVLRSRIAAKLAALGPDDPARGLWKTLESDLESALADFEDLIRAGLGADDFPRPELRAAFGEMTAWVGEHGYALGPRQDQAGADEGPGLAPVADRLLILAGGAEGRSDFPGLVALAWRCPSVTVVVAEPEFLGTKPSDEEWALAWENALGAQAVPIGSENDPEGACVPVSELWSGSGGSAERADLLVGCSRSDEIGRVAGAIERLLATGSENIAVILPSAGASHARLLGLLEQMRIPYADLIGAAGTAPVDIRIQRALADFYGRGCRLEELLALWPLLRFLSLTELTPALARIGCQRLFDDVQSHAIDPHLDRLAASDRDDWRELARIARLLMPAWPEQLTPSEALDRFEAARDRLTAGEPAGWGALREFARRATEPMPSAALLEAIRSFLPEKAPARTAPGRTTFARVTLTTCRRAAGIAWSDVIYMESNAEIWPARREPSVWLGDKERRAFGNAAGGFALGLPTSDDRMALERRLHCAVARDTRRRVIFSAALFDEEEPEERLRPNAWLERVMWDKGLLPERKGEGDAFERLARAIPREEEGVPRREAGWAAIGLRRRDPGAPFDEYFLGDPRGASARARFSAKQIERGVADPAVLWFEGVLRLRRVEWRGFHRARGKAAGEIVHRVLASALRGAPVEGRFTEFPALAAAETALAAGLRRLRERWPVDRYWESFHMDVSSGARELLAAVYALPPSPFGAVEVNIPDGATIPVGDGRRAAVSGRMDLVLSDRPHWSGATVQIVDFKTGGDSGVSAKKMASSGTSLQLGVYLAAAASMGATGKVWMLKPGELPSNVATEELEMAVAKLRIIGDHLETGLYGARTPDRTEYNHIFEWPIACAPIAAAILDAKFSATFGGSAEAELEEDADE
jgi:hypothetical protein